MTWLWFVLALWFSVTLWGCLLWSYMPWPILVLMPVLWPLPVIGCLLGEDVER